MEARKREKENCFGIPMKTLWDICRHEHKTSKKQREIEKKAKGRGKTKGEVRMKATFAVMNTKRQESRER